MKQKGRMLVRCCGFVAAALIDHGVALSQSPVVRHDTTLNECLAAARKMHKTLQHTPADSEPTPGDTVGLGAIAPVVRACGARFTLANTPMDALDSLFQLALYEENDTLAQAVVNTLLPHRMAWFKPPKLPPGAIAFTPKSAYNPDSGGSYLGEVMLAYTDFGRVAAASTLQTQVSMQGPSDYFFQLRYHGLLKHRLATQQPRDDARLLVEIEQVLHLTETRATTTDSTKLEHFSYFANWNTYPDLFELLWRQHADSATVWALAARVKRDMVRYRYATEQDHFSNDVVDENVSYNHWPEWERLTLRGVLNAEGTSGPWKERWPNP